MEYEKELSCQYSERDIQENIKIIDELSRKKWNVIKDNNNYKNLNKEGLKALREKNTDDKGVHLNGRKGLIDDIDKKIKNIDEETERNKHRRGFKIDESKLDKYKCVLNYFDMRKDLIYKIGGEEEADEFLNKYGITVLYELSKLALESKQCNEPWEKLLSELLDLINLDEKHGFDAEFRKDDILLEVYEYKPSSDKNNPQGTINDDSIEKIEKCENLEAEGTKGWLILAGIDKEKYTINIIYKFPLEIYNEKRREYFNGLKEKNKNKEKQTRSTYTITIGGSINLCNKYDKDYYVWEK